RRERGRGAGRGGGDRAARRHRDQHRDRARARVERRGAAARRRVRARGAAGGRAARAGDPARRAVAVGGRRRAHGGGGEFRRHRRAPRARTGRGGGRADRGARRASGRRARDRSRRIFAARRDARRDRAGVEERKRKRERERERGRRRKRRAHAMSDRAADEQAAHGLAGVVARHGRGIALAVALVVGAGTLAFFSLPRGLYPELSFPRIAVVATLPDATSQIVLLNVTRPLEEALAPLLGVRRVRSKTIRGATELSLQFDPDTDMVTALQLVQARLADTRAELPPQTTLVTERITPTSFPVFTVNVDGAVPPSTLRDVALYQVRPALSRVPGVGPISVTAGEEREVEVEVDPARAEAAGLTLDDIGKRLADSNRFATVGRLDRAYRRYTVGLQGTALSVAALGDFVVGGGDRAPVRLGDVARISEGHADPRLVVRSARGPAAVVNVARRIGGDVIALDGELRAALGQLEKELPTGVTLTPVYQQARLIGDATGAVRDAILLGALL